ncbi:hypothetical protein CMI41_02685 [Candidatus Pacearchaeota archaeon]|nr:hypothetical protein [Candidatus Pacearchaeota archaeon]|tara:strand:+ start:14174 stop:14599 length:426 start_codon:yes stop_codon:yes gene_type:complete
MKQQQDFDGAGHNSCGWGDVEAEEESPGRYRPLSQGTIADLTMKLGGGYRVSPQRKIVINGLDLAFYSDSKGVLVAYLNPSHYTRNVGMALRKNLLLAVLEDCCADNGVQHSVSGKEEYLEFIDNDENADAVCSTAGGNIR